MEPFFLVARARRANTGFSGNLRTLFWSCLPPPSQNGLPRTRVVLYARVSTSDEGQNPETQLLPLREFCHAQGWEVAGEFVDHASTTDLRGRTAWRDLIDSAARRRVYGLVRYG